MCGGDATNPTPIDINVPLPYTIWYHLEMAKTSTKIMFQVLLRHLPLKTQASVHGTELHANLEHFLWSRSCPPRSTRTFVMSRVLRSRGGCCWVSVVEDKTRPRLKSIWDMWRHLKIDTFSSILAQTRQIVWYYVCYHWIFITMCGVLVSVHSCPLLPNAITWIIRWGRPKTNFRLMKFGLLFAKWIW